MMAKLKWDEHTKYIYIYDPVLSDAIAGSQSVEGLRGADCGSCDTTLSLEIAYKFSERPRGY